MTLKWCACVAVLLVLSTVAQNFNLVMQQTTRYSPLFVSTAGLPKGGERGSHHVFDRRTASNWTGMTKGKNFKLSYTFDRGMTIRQYTIVISIGLPLETYPKNWVVTAVGPNSSHSRVLHEVTNAQFRPATTGNRGAKFRGWLRAKDIKTLTFRFTEDSVPGDGKLEIGLSEIALIGPKSQLNDPGFPGGAYPCADSMRLIKPPSRPQSYFGRADLEHAMDTRMKEFVKELFSEKKRNAGTPGVRGIEVTSHDRSDVYLGCVFDKPIQVLQYSWKDESSGTWGFKLQGNKCEPNCKKFGSDGWVMLSTQPAVEADGRHTYQDRPFMHPVEAPDFYKAYRFVMTPSLTNDVNDWGQRIHDIDFFQCRPGDVCTTTCDSDDVLQNPGSSSCTCRECVNDKGGLERDTGCSDGMPLCGAPDQQYSDECFVCLNDRDESQEADTGCPDPRPNCRANPGEYGPECFGTVCELNDIDVCVAVDGSGSISNSEFATEVNFVVDLVAAFANVQGATVRWGGNQFSGSVADIIPGFTSSADTFTNALTSMIKLGGGTNIGDALLNCEDKLTGSASTSNNKLFILITDGRNGGPHSNAQILDFGTNLKASAQIFTIGAGTGSSTNDFLTLLATDPSIFFSASSINNISEVTSAISTRLCETTEI